MSIFNERVALQMSLQSLLDQRSLLRKEYVDQDKAIGSEIKEILQRIRELDQNDSLEIEAVESKQPTKSNHVKRKHGRHDYSIVGNQIIEILTASDKPVSLTELTDRLKSQYSVEFSNPYIGIHKAVKQVERVKTEKSGRQVLFILET